MASLPAISVSECEPTRTTRLSTIPPSDPSASRRSLSIKPSLRSSRSRITLVGYDESLEPKFESEYGASSDAGDYSWLDHLLAVFCIPRRPKLEPARIVVPESPPRYQDHEVHVASPWVLPVYVLSTERDQHRHMIPREAKCTIDTGNLQGNTVSREFVVDVLGYTENDFHKLTKEEEDGGRGITGHKLIPDGAIYLTWYHSNSTRVFRDMRFLISEHPMFDLIIGARSIQKNNILDVPNLMTSGATIWSTFLDEDITNSQTLKELESTMNTLKDEHATYKTVEIKKIIPKPSPEKKKQLLDASIGKFEAAKTKFYDELRKEYQNEIRKAEHKRSHPTDKSSKWRQGYKELYQKDLPFPLPEKYE